MCRALVHRNKCETQFRMRKTTEHSDPGVAAVHQVPKNLNQHHREQSIKQSPATATLLECLLEDQCKHATGATDLIKWKADEGRQGRRNRIRAATIEAQLGAGEFGTFVFIDDKPVCQGSRVQQQTGRGDQQFVGALLVNQHPAPPDQMQLASVAIGCQLMVAAQGAGMKHLRSNGKMLEQGFQSVGHFDTPSHVSRTASHAKYRGTA